MKNGWLFSGRYIQLKIFLFLLLIAAVNFHTSIHNPFLMDDSVHYLDAKKRNLGFLLYNIIPDLSKKAGFNEYENSWNYYRPVAHFIVTLEGIVFKENISLYFLASLFIFALACLSIYNLLMALTGNRFVSLCAAFLYLLHPFNGLCVNYKTAIVFTLQMWWLNICFIYVVQLLKGEKLFTWGKYFGYLLLYLMALLMHELAFVFPVLLFAFWMFVFQTKNKKSFLFCFGFALVAFIYFIVRLKVAALNVSILGAVAAYNVQWWERLAGYAKIIQWVLGKLFYPRDIFIQWTTPLDKSMAMPWVMVFLVYVSSFSCLLFLFFRRNRMMFLFLLMFLVGFVLGYPGSFYALSMGLMFFEPHWIFYTSIGFFALISMCIDRTRIFYSKAPLIVLIFLTSTLMIFSQKQNQLYNDPRAYFIEWSKATPGYDLPVLGVCLGYLKTEDFEKALTCYGTLIDTHMQYMAFMNLGALYLQKNDYVNSKRYFEKLLDTGMNMSAGYRGLARVAQAQGDYIKAQSELDNSLKYDKLSLDTLLLKYEFYNKDKQTKEALKILQKIIAYYGYSDNIYLNTVQTSFQLGNIEQVVQYAQEIIKESKDPETLVALTSILYIIKQDKMAEDSYLKAFNLNRIKTLQATATNNALLKAKETKS